MTALKVALNQAVKRGMISRNPCFGVVTPKAPKKKIQVLTELEVDQFLRTAKSHRLYVLFYLVVALGVRQGEAFALRWNDIDLENGLLHIKHTLEELSGKLRLVPPKTERSRRTLELPLPLIEALRGHRSRTQAEGGTGDWVFCDSQGGPLRKSNFLRRDYYPLLKNAGVAKDGFTFHDLRHTAASLMLSRGVSLLEVSEILGHEDEAFTLKTYAHVLPTMRRAATAKIGAFFQELLED